MRVARKHSFLYGRTGCRLIRGGRGLLFLQKGIHQSRTSIDVGIVFLAIILEFVRQVDGEGHDSHKRKRTVEAVLVVHVFDETILFFRMLNNFGGETDFFTLNLDNLLVFEVAKRDILGIFDLVGGHPELNHAHVDLKVSEGQKDNVWEKRAVLSFVKADQELTAAESRLLADFEEGFVVDGVAEGNLKEEVSSIGAEVHDLPVFGVGTIIDRNSVMELVSDIFHLKILVPF
jgi:hypothetical protein